MYYSMRKFVSRTRNVTDICSETFLYYCSVEEGIFDWRSKLLSLLWSPDRYILYIGLFIPLGRFFCSVSNVPLDPGQTLSRTCPMGGLLNACAANDRNSTLEQVVNSDVKEESHYKMMEFWTKCTDVESHFTMTCLILAYHFTDCSDTSSWRHALQHENNLTWGKAADWNDTAVYSRFYPHHHNVEEKLLVFFCR